MAEIWPAGLPTHFLVDAFQQSFAENRLRTQMDRGPVKMRRSTTADIRTIAGAMVVDGTQLAVLETFWNTTTIGGVLAFIFPNQTGAGTVLARFGEQAPTVSYMGINLWRVELALEIIP